MKFARGLQGIAGFLGASAVILGALGSHALKDRLTPEALGIFETGVLYHLAHAIVLLAASFFARHSSPQAFLKIAAGLWVLGILLFSGGLYIYSVFEVRVGAHAAPIGGLCLILGWLTICAGSFTKPPSNFDTSR